jgi:amidase
VTVDLDRSTASDLVVDLANGSISSGELLEAQLERIDRFNPSLNAVVALDVDRARVRARAADDARSRGERWGPLHGLPMTVKDSFETEGIVTTSGAPELAGHVPTHDADAVALLKAAGAIVFGKTNVPLYTGDWQSYNDVYGITRNPWNPERTVGGSSGGSAAAVAAGMSTLEVGSDIGGSIRVPSHYCGVFGHKATWSAIPHRGHVPGPPGSLAGADLGVMGPIGRSVSDLELALSVLVGDDLGGVPGGRLPPSSPRLRTLHGCRVGVWLETDLVPTSAAVLDVLRGLVDRLSDAGALVDDAVRPATPVSESLRVYEQLLFSVMGAGFPPQVHARLRELAASAPPDDPSQGVRTARGVTMSHTDWLRANEQRARIAAEWAEVFTSVDVVLAPISSVVAFPHDVERPFDQRQLDVDGRSVPYDSHLVWAGLATLPLLPATAVPVGRSPDGLPVGVQIIGPRWGDLTTLAFARLVEQLTGGFVPPPLT